ncbi:amino acid transporter [Pholiota molesta]|nr:amino acid transporter [Pholiota molesta]
MTSPSQPVPIRSPPRRGFALPTADSDGLQVGSHGTTPIGTTDLRALRAQYAGTPPLPNIPLRNTGTPSSRRDSWSIPAPTDGSPRRPGPSALGGLSATRQPNAATSDPSVPPIDLDDLPDEEKAKVLERHLSSAASLLEVPSGSESGRTLSDEDSEPFPIPYDAHGADVTHDIYKWHSDQKKQAGRPPHPAFEHIHEPGGFRRNYLLLHLEDEDEEDKEDEETIAGLESADVTTGLPDVSETTALLGSPNENSVSRQGTATVTQAVLMLLKSFVGTGVLFLGKAFFNGGLLFSALTFTFIACISLYSFLLLVKTKFVVSGSFGGASDTVLIIRSIHFCSIVVSQMGFVGAYTIFAFVLGITDCVKLIPVQYFIVVQLIVFLPMALVRDLAKLSSTALVADVFILAGLIYIFSTFNPKDFLCLTAVFSFEGIGLVIPITDAMREPHKFPMALTGVMAFLLCLFGGAGALAYLTFGSDIQTVVLVNLNPRSKMVQTVQFFYACAILLSVPLQLFPAVRILENGLFTRSGKADARVKWLKNSFRFAMVWVGAADLDKFVAFIGCTACVPLCLRDDAQAEGGRYRLIIFGMLAAAYTSIQTIKLMLEPAPAEGSPYGSCESGGS